MKRHAYSVLCSATYWSSERILNHLLKLWRRFSYFHLKWQMQMQFYIAIIIKLFPANSHNLWRLQESPSRHFRQCYPSFLKAGSTPCSPPMQNQFFSVNAKTNHCFGGATCPHTPSPHGYRLMPRFPDITEQDCCMNDSSTSYYQHPRLARC